MNNLPNNTKPKNFTTSLKKLIKSNNSIYI